MPFDPYHKWLGIPPAEQPPNCYRLLGLSQFEADPDVISNAADQRMGYLRSFQSGEHSDEAARLLNALATARRVLLSEKERRHYNHGLLLPEMVVAPPPIDRLNVVLAEVVAESLPRLRPPLIPRPQPPRPEGYHYEPRTREPVAELPAAEPPVAEPPAALEYTPTDAIIGWLLLASCVIIFAIMAASQ